MFWVGSDVAGVFFVLNVEVTGLLENGVDVVDSLEGFVEIIWVIKVRYNSQVVIIVKNHLQPKKIKKSQEII